MYRLSARLPTALLTLLCSWQLALLLAFALQARITDLPRLALGGLVRSAVPLYAGVGVLLWIVAHESAHAIAARCCGVLGGRIRFSARLMPAFQAPAQPALNRSDTRFLIYVAGPVLDLLCSLALAVAAMSTSAGTAILQSLFVISLLMGLPNCCVLRCSDMEQGMRVFRLLCHRRWPSILYGAVSLAYASVVILMVVKLILRSRPGMV